MAPNNQNKKKELSQMTLSELWHLFPIILTEPDDRWADFYTEEKRALLSLLPADKICRISHIGSTAVGFIWAKPTVDILLEIKSKDDIGAVSDIIQKGGWLLMKMDNYRISFNKGYTPDGFADKVYHLHLRTAGDNDELYFRDYLISHPDIAQSYEKLKLSLLKQYEFNRDGYTSAKTAFIQEYTQKAKLLYLDRYSVNK